jgi:Mrp family chromosome partitioning ATPase
VVSDAMPLLRKVDGVVLVSQLGKNTRDAAAFLRDRLRGVNAPLLGVVANGVRAKGKDGYGYGYGYGYYGPDEPVTTNGTGEHEHLVT